MPSQPLNTRDTLPVGRRDSRSLVRLARLVRLDRFVLLVMVVSIFSGLRTAILIPPVSQAQTAPKAKTPVEFEATLGTPGKFEVFNTPFKAKILGTLDQSCKFHASIICVASTVSVSVAVFGSGLPKTGKRISLTYVPGLTTNPESASLVKGWWFAIVASSPRGVSSTVNDSSLVLKVQNFPISTTRALSDFQITISRSGGRCATNCKSEATIKRDGNWTWQWIGRGLDGRVSGTLDQALAQKLFGLLTHGSLTEIRSIIPTETGCPSRVDGKDITFQFVAGDVALSADNCHLNLSSHPLLATTSEALSEMLSKTQLP
jgi:hypothetical protein